MYKNESQMYPEVKMWLNRLLSSSHKKGKIEVFNTSNISLWKFLKKKRYDGYFDNYITYEIRVDVTGIVIKKEKAFLSFVECKMGPISLKDVSQLIGYSKVAMPEYAIIISPKGVSRCLNYLLRSYNRYDILDYGNGRKVKIGVWDSTKKEIDIRSILPPGEHLSHR